MFSALISGVVMMLLTPIISKLGFLLDVKMFKTVSNLNYFSNFEYLSHVQIPHYMWPRNSTELMPL